MKCLVTKLKGTASGQGFEKIGALKIKLYTITSDLVYVHFYSIIDQTLTLDGSSYFTNAQNQENKGQTIQVSSGRNLVFVSAKAGETNLYFSNKEGISELTSDTKGTPIWSATNNGYKTFLNSKDLKYCVNLTAITFAFNNLYGVFDLEDFADTNITLFVLPDTMAEVRGDVKNILKSNALLSVILQGQSGVTGDLVSFAGKQITSGFNLSGTGVGGDLTSLSEVSAPQILLKDIPKLITGNLGYLNNNTRFISFGSSANVNLTFDDWHQGTRTKFLGVEGGYFEWGINQFIVKSSKLTLDSGLEDYGKKINVLAYGLDLNYTGVALQALRSKGVDVIINHVLVN